MSLEELTTRVRDAIGGDCGVEKTIEFNFTEDGVIYIDGTVKPNVIDNEDRESDLMVRVAIDDFRKILDREVKGQKLVLSGKVKLKGDIRIAMKLDDILKVA